MTRSSTRLVALVWPALFAAACDVEQRTSTFDATVDARTPLPDAAPEAATWGEVTLGPLVLSAWGPSPNEVFFAGGSPVNGGFIGRLVGDHIEAEDIPPGPALWWVWGADRDSVRAAGEGGRLLRRTSDGWVAESTGLSDRAQLWGGFSPTPDDHWAVGGAVRRGGEKGIVLRKRGDGPWALVTDPAFPTETNLFKVWGTGPDDVHLVGEAGVAIHWDGRAFKRFATPDPELLFTVHGRAGGPVLAVGGVTAGRVLRLEGEAWVDDGAPAVPALNGVFVRPDGSALMSGTNGTLLLRNTDGTYSSLARAALQPYTLHAVFSAANDWAVGGDLARGDVGIVSTNRAPLPLAPSRGPVAPPTHADSGTPDAAPVPGDAHVADAAAPPPPTDALPTPDVARPAPDAARPTPDAARPTADAAAPMGDAAPGRDALPPPPPDARPPEPDAPPPPPPDAALPDAAVPDAAPPLPGPGEPCQAADYLCAAPDQDCYSVITPNGFSEPLCLQPCVTPDDCDPAFGPNPCCAAPGPQLIAHYCFAAALRPEGCP
jgi:hypothetical protein